ncbi:HIT family protein [Polyangium aurulentum]|uniref:HIT family protein n=1 Tax=Polyangium aurulentum TaxID=2567896 RepID=UPI0010AED7EA|nr:HIT family protein [Polyangium aurulentum]UQA59618.1 HIT family protein [Polyangium aurulentum]
MSANCIFCRIVSGEVPGHLVLDEPGVLAFLDTKPLFPGHCLVVPRGHVETLVDLPDEQITPLFSAAKRIAAVLPDVLGAEGTFVAMNNRVSQSVPHLHVHVVPRKKKDGLKGFFWPRSSYASDEQIAEVARSIREALG